jgi:hypothetical protein
MEPDNQRPFIDQSFDDEWLDAALKQCGAAEPRSGLEGRVLARIRTERVEPITSAWRRWPALAVAGAMLLISVAVFLRGKSGTVTPASVANHTPIVREETGKTTKSPGKLRSRQAPRIVAHASRRHSGEGTATPHLDQFPAPLRLSEQEKILANYIEQFPHQALLEARVQTELLREELIERQELSPKDGTTQDSKDENR